MVIVWTLRSWKLQEMDVLNLAREQEATEARDNDTAAALPNDVVKGTPAKGGGYSLASYMKKFIAIEQV